MTEKRNANGGGNAGHFLVPGVPDIEEMKLPSGLQVKLRSPLREGFWIRAGDPPAFLLRAGRAGRKRQRFHTAEATGWPDRMVAALVAEPIFSMDPKPGETHPRCLEPEDRAFLDRYFELHMDYVLGVKPWHQSEEQAA